MNQPLIFTEQRFLPRAIDVLLTLVAWIGFIYLIYKGLITALTHSPYMGVRPFFTTLDTVTFLYPCCSGEWPGADWLGEVQPVSLPGGTPQP